MAFITDFTLLNNAGTANWNTVNFDTPQLNDANNPTPFYLEGPACFYWWLKKGQTGNTDQSTSGITGGLGNRICVAWMNYPYAEIGAIPITTFDLRLGSTSFTSNYIEQDALVQLEQPYNLPISGHTPIMLHPGNVTGSNGTFSTTGTTLYYGWSVVTGNDNDGKQGGFDWFLVIGWIGGHSATYTQTYYSTMYAEAYDSNGGGIPGTANRPLGIISKSGNNYTVNVSLQVGQAGATATTVTETGKNVYFNNIADTQSIGYIFVNGTGDLNINLTSVVHSWNAQTETGAQIFTGVNNCDIFKITGCTFINGGGVELPSHTTNRWITESTFNNCGEIDIGDGTFENNVISGSTSGVLYTGTGTRRSKNNTYSGNTDALHFDTAQTITLDGDSFSGNTDDIHFSGTGTLTIDLTNGANPTTSRVTGGGTVVINQPSITITQTCSTADGTGIQNARVLVEASDGTGPMPYQDSITITRVTTTATVAHTAHGMVTGDKVLIKGAVQTEYNGIKTITVTTVNAYTYTVAGTPTTPATGTILVTWVVLSGLTDINGEISTTKVLTADQPVSGWGRKSTTSPLYVQGSINGTIDYQTGYSQTAVLISDE